jgi:hypothetical protein
MNEQTLAIRFRWMIAWALLSGGTPIFATTEKPNFQDDVFPLFDQSCNSCHNPDKAKGGLDLTSVSAILAGGSSGEVVMPGEGTNSYLYKLVAHLEKPFMPREKGKLPQPEIDLIKKWIDLGLLPTASGKPMKKKKSSLNLALADAPTGKPKGPPPMPEHLSLEPSVITARPAALSALAVNPWSPLAALSGQKQIILYHTDTREILGVLPYPEGFVESLVFSRNGLLLMAGGGRGGKMGRIAAWNVKTGRRVLSMGEEYDTILSSDISADQTLVALGGPAKKIKVYDLVSGEILHDIKKHSEWVTAVAFSPDGVLLATGDRNGGLYVWEARSGNLFYTLSGHKETITSLSWRTDSNMLASASEEGRVRVWEMFNGKEVRSWAAHGGGALSVDMDKKGNFVTAGRDRTVKLWKPDGAAIRTISGFSEMTLEARFSHDGTLVVAGDWSGAVGIWNVADGKKLGDLQANPPALNTRLADAQSLVSQREPIATAAKAKHAPLAQARADATKKLSEAQATAQAADLSSKAADDALVAAQLANAQATTARNQATAEKAARQTARDQKAKQLVDAQVAEKSNRSQSASWGNRSSFRADQISLLRENHRKAQEARQAIPEDDTLKEAVAKQQEALEAMEKAFVSAKNKTAALLAEAEKLKKIAVDHAAGLTTAEETLKKAEAALAQREQSLLEITSVTTAAKAEQVSGLTARNAAQKLLEQRTKEQAAAQAAEKGPAEELRSAESSLASARKSVAKWSAEKINVDRHLELGELEDLQEELQLLEETAAKTKDLHAQSLAALEAARKALANVPDQIKTKEDDLARRQADMGKEDQHLQLTQKRSDEKQSFLSQVENISKATKAKADGDAKNAELAGATSKLAESLELLKKDLGNAQAGIIAQQQKLKTAQLAVENAKSSLDKTKLLTQTIPKLIEEKQGANHATKVKHAEANQRRDDFKGKVEGQRGKADLLLKQYLDALPK